MLKQIGMVTLLLSGVAAAEDVAPAVASKKPENTLWLLTLHWENDGTVLKPNHNTDRYYTNGFVASFTLRDTEPAQLIDLLPAFDDFTAGHRAFGIALGHHINTANDITQANPPLNDHPYSGYLYLAGFWERSNADTLDHVEVNAGVVGPSSYADDIQAGVHDFFDEPDPQGWDTQLGDEPVIQFYFRKKWKFGDKPAYPTWTGQGFVAPAPMATPAGESAANPLQFQVIPQVGLALGLAQRHLEGGALVRVGWNLPDDFGPSRIADLTANGFGQPGALTVYGFARIGGRIVEHDMFIEGSNFEKSRGAEAETFVGEAQAGIGIAWRADCFDLHATYSQTVLSRQFEGQNGTHAFGALTFGVRVRF